LDSGGALDSEVVDLVDLRVLDLVDSDLLLMAPIEGLLLSGQERRVRTIGGIERTLKVLGDVKCLWEEFNANQ
jgi:hypothetical protein